MCNKNISEENLIDFLKVILNVEGEITLQDFKQRVRESFNLTEYDLSVSSSRRNEAIYEQRCRNLNSHKNFPENAVYENQVFKLK